MESDKAHEFFVAGLQHYGKALVAIYEFREMLQDHLQNVMLAQPQDSTLKLAAEPAFTTSRAGQPNTYHSVIGTLAQPVTDPTGTIANPGRLDVGVWWTPPFPCKTIAALYAGASGVPWSKRIVKPQGFDGGLYKGSAATYLTRDLTTHDSFSTVIQALLGHLDVACKQQQIAAVVPGRVFGS